ncbi:unnamed protein product [Effrenium voratum]|nr:unnamed protein product [Effrenium voratum]
MTTSRRSWVAENNYELLSLLKGFFGPGGFIHPRLQVRRSGGRGLVASRPLKSDEVLLQVPLDCLLRHPLPWDQLSWRPAVELNQDEELIVFLAALRKYGVYSEWFRYLLTLPEWEVNSTLSWQPEEVLALKGTPAHGEARRLRRGLRSLCDRNLGLDCEELRWAAGHFWSRAWQFRGSGSSFRALVPGVDLINFHPDSRNYFRMAGKSIVYIAGQDYAEGEEVLDNYGGKNDTFLLTHYGILHEDPGRSYAHLELPRVSDLRDSMITAVRPDRQLKIWPGGIVDGANLLRLALAPELSAYDAEKLLSRSPPRWGLRGERAVLAWLVASCQQQLDRQNAVVRLGQCWLVETYRARLAGLWHQCAEEAGRRLWLLNETDCGPGSSTEVSRSSTWLQAQCEGCLDLGVDTKARVQGRRGAVRSTSPARLRGADPPAPHGCIGWLHLRWAPCQRRTFCSGGWPAWRTRPCAEMRRKDERAIGGSVCECLR